MCQDQKCQGCIQPTRGPLVVLNQLAYPSMWNGNELLLDRFNQVFFPRFWSDKPHEVFRLLADEYAKEQFFESFLTNHDV